MPDSCHLGALPTKCFSRRTVYFRMPTDLGTGQPGGRALPFGNHPARVRGADQDCAQRTTDGRSKVGHVLVVNMLIYCLAPTLPLCRA